MTQTAPTANLTDLLDRYATLRDTIQGLEAERDQLGAELKAALLDGHTAQTSLYRAEVRVSTVTEYPVDRFREVFGDAATLEVATVDRKKADALVKAGDLDGTALGNIAVKKSRAQSLVLIPVTA